MTVSRTGTTPTPFGFVGGAQYQTDPDSGLMLLGNRYYDSSIGRFITQDPIGDGDNWYGYVENNPLTGIDPEGLQRAQGKWGKSSRKPPPRRGVGPSGRPKIIIIKYPSKGAAKEGARNAGQGEPAHDTAKNGRPGHFHPVDKDGKRLNDGSHHTYPFLEGPYRVIPHWEPLPPKDLTVPAILVGVVIIIIKIFKGPAPLPI